MRPAARKHRERRGFTLIELSVVLLIIGILMSFVLVATYEGVERGQVRATQALIAKLDVGYTERYEALLAQTVEPNAAHKYLAAVFPANVPPRFLPWGTNYPVIPGTPPTVQTLESESRAAVIAKVDYLKRELPDVFFVDNTTDLNYPINFAGLPYDSPDAPRTPYNYVLPLGNSVLPVFLPGSFDALGNALDSSKGPGAGIGGPGEGIYGASYSARAAVNKLLGYLPQGYDGVDNDADGWIDEWDEGIGADAPVTDPYDGQTRKLSEMINGRLGRHTHKTARAEALYALLVEGRGVFGSVFTADDFAPNEVKDTDNDGLPEFVDAWGEPLQFFRWPTHHIQPGLQKGTDAYENSFEPRQKSGLDPNGLLTSPAWWSSFNGPGPKDPVAKAPELWVPTATPSDSLMSNHAFTFQNFFFPLVDMNIDQPLCDPSAPQPAPGCPPVATLWDQGGRQRRRAFFARHLIVSGGPDRRVGIGMLGTDYSDFGLAPIPVTAQRLVRIENTGSAWTPYRIESNGQFWPYDPMNSASMAVQSANFNSSTGEGWMLDDVSNQNLPTANGGIR